MPKKITLSAGGVGHIDENIFWFYLNYHKINYISLIQITTILRASLFIVLFT